MRSISTTLMFVLVSIFSFSVIANAQTGKYVEIKVGYANVYKKLDPQSEIIKQAKKGDRLELIYDGTSWYQVKIETVVGWVEKRSGDIVNSKNSFPTVPVIGIIILGCVIAVFAYNSKKKHVND